MMPEQAESIDVWIPAEKRECRGNALRGGNEESYRPEIPTPAVEVSRRIRVREKNPAGLAPASIGKQSEEDSETARCQIQKKERGDCSLERGPGRQPIDFAKGMEGIDEMPVCFGDRVPQEMTAASEKDSDED